jgi:hypothetical protein
VTPGEFLSARLDDHQVAVAAHLVAHPNSLPAQQVDWMLKAQREILGMLSGALEGQVEAMAEGDFLGQAIATSSYESLNLAIASLCRVYRNHPDYDPNWEMA